MTCADIEILLCDYVDGTLRGDEKAAVEEHLVRCAFCARMAEDAAAAVEFLHKAAPVEPPPELVTRLLYQVPAARERHSQGGLRAWLSRWIGPVLQPRFAMGMAMTVLSFSLVARIAGIPERQLRPSDLHPAKVWAAIEDRAHRVWDRGVKYYESLKVVYEIQSRLSEWTEEPAAPPAGGGASSEGSAQSASPAARETRIPDTGEQVNDER